jgi:hypothetical protein
MSELAKWDSFYGILGSAAATLIGLQFIVLTLIAARPSLRIAEAGAAFGTPTIVHFSSTLLLAAILRAPWQTISASAIGWGLTGFGGLAYSIIVWRRLSKVTVYKPQFEDWLFHLILPLAAYTTLAVTAFAAPFRTVEALFGAGGSALVLLFAGIHNAWDSIAYHVFVKIPGSETARQEEREQR